MRSKTDCSAAAALRWASEPPSPAIVSASPEDEDEKEDEDDSDEDEDADTEAGAARFGIKLCAIRIPRGRSAGKYVLSAYTADGSDWCVIVIVTLTNGSALTSSPIDAITLSGAVADCTGSTRVSTRSASASEYRALSTTRSKARRWRLWCARMRISERNSAGDDKEEDEEEDEEEDDDEDDTKSMVSHVDRRGCAAGCNSAASPLVLPSLPPAPSLFSLPSSLSSTVRACVCITALGFGFGRTSSKAVRYAAAHASFAATATMLSARCVRDEENHRRRKIKEEILDFVFRMMMQVF